MVAFSTAEAISFPVDPPATARLIVSPPASSAKLAQALARRVALVPPDRPAANVVTTD
jgi:hypothetical protein